MSAAATRTASRRSQAPGLAYERRWWAHGAVVAGVDEVGRGAWAGPVTFAAVVLPSDRRMYKLRDSKELPAATRTRLAARLHGFAVAVSIGQATNAEIDGLGMSAAMRLAARRAVAGLPEQPDVCLLDGNWDFLRDPVDGELATWQPPEREQIVGGDRRSASIAAASIVAKVARDALMTTSAAEHPVYAFASNKGYRSPVHRRALDTHGPCPLHRASWAPVRRVDADWGD